MPWDKEEPGSAEVPEPRVRSAGLDDDRERRLAARRFFRSAPPYCIEFDTDGTAMLCRKSYEYWPDREPEDATSWRMISRHQNLEEAEQRLRLLCGGPVFYDAEGRVVEKGPQRRPCWDIAPIDDE